MTYVDKEEEVSSQEARDSDAQNKQANKDYVDKKFHARERDVREGDVFLLEQKRENRLSSSFEREPYEVLAQYGDRVVLQSPEGVQYRRNLQHIKPFKLPEREHHVTSQQEPEPVTERVLPQASPAPSAASPLSELKCHYRKLRYPHHKRFQCLVQSSRHL